jgi:opacity protein-like surface antigen
MRKLIIVVVILSLGLAPLRAQTDSARVKRLNRLALYGGIGYGVTLFALSQAWYSDQGLSHFRFFNDNPQWKQVDKIGHFYSTYHFARIGHGLLTKAGLEERKSALWSSALGAGLLLPVEILDGFSPEFGFSYGDVIANAAGSAFFLGQHLLWQEQRIKPKFSFHQTSLAAQRPEVLGHGLAEELLKDYNGQSYWFSFDIHAFAKNSDFPKWLNLGLGYGAQNMVFARDGQNESAGFQNFRQYYLGIDFDLSYIHTDKKWLKTVLFLLDGIRLPAPALEINKSSSRFRLFYY